MVGLPFGEPPQSRTAEQNDEGDELISGAWLFLRGRGVPDRWRDRAIVGSMVPLLPHEYEAVLSRGGAPSVLRSEDVELLKLVSQGMVLAQVARTIGVTPRTVQRRLSRLRERFGVSSTTELVAEVSRGRLLDDV